MRLLLLTQDFPPDVGGIQTYCAELARRFAASCDAFAVMAPRVAGDEEVDAALPYPVHRVTATSNTLPFRAIRPLRRLLREGDFDVVLHAQWQTLPASVAARRRGFKGRIVLAAHGRELLLAPLSSLGPAQRVYDAFRRRMVHHVDLVLPVSRYTGGLVAELGIPTDRMVVVSNGTDPEHFRPLDVSDLRQELGLTGVPVLLSVGRLTPRKGFDTVIEALPSIRRQVPEAVYVLVGGGEDRERLEALARTHGVADAVRFVGKVAYADLPRWFNLGDVFVTPSRLQPPSVEGFGIVFLEANACGKPVIGARSGGVPDAVLDGETGLLVAPDDSADLADAALRLLKDPDLARTLGQQGLERVRREATWDVVHARIAAAIDGVARGIDSAD